MISLRILMRKRVLGLGVTWSLVLAGGGLVVAACGSDTEDCAQTQTCIGRSPDAGAGGEDNQGGTAGANGGSSGSGPGSGGSSGSDSGRGGTSGSDNGGTSGSDSGGTTAGGMAGMGGEGGEPTGGTSGSATGGMSGGGSGGEGGSDTSPPSIVSVSPADGTTGVRSDENIVITFSEAMDHATTEAAFMASDLRPATFSWNTSSTVLTVNPQFNISYAEGSNPSVPAREYTVTLTTAAEDESGNWLADDFTWSFHSLRRITHAIPIAWSSILGVHTTINAHNDCTSADSSAHAGDLADNTAEYILVSAEISSLPPGLTLESANLSAEQTSIVGDPYALGNLYAYATNVHPPTSANWGTTPISGNLVFSSNATIQKKMVDVSAVLNQHYAERVQRNNLSQYRLQFDPLQSDNNDDQDQAQFRCGSFVLTAIYTLP